jgi:tetratricopeptide (TPR) repeat protein
MSNIPKFSHTDKKPNNLESITLDESILHMKNLIQLNIKNGLYNNALFYADKIFYLSLNKEMFIISDHLFDLAHCFFLNKEYYRCVNLIQKYNMTYYNQRFLNLLGQALLSCEDYESVLTYLDKEHIQFENLSEELENYNFYQSIRYLLVAKAYEMQENKTPAIRNYINAFKLDPGNIEAFDNLINHQLLSNEQKMRLKHELNLNRNNQWLYDYYLSKLDDNIFMTVNSDVVVSSNEENGNLIDILYSNSDQDFMKIEAEKFFTARDYTNAYNKLKKINDEDFYKLDILPMYCSCMVELNKIGELYSLAHKLASNCSDKFVSWFAVVRILLLNVKNF